MFVKVANTVELKNKTYQLLRRVMKGEPVIVTYRGKPAASLIPLTEDDPEDFIGERSPKIRKMIAQAEADRKAGRRSGPRASRRTTGRADRGGRLPRRLDRRDLLRLTPRLPVDQLVGS